MFLKFCNIYGKTPMPELLSQQSCRSEACNFMRRETLAQVFSCKFWKIFKDTFFKRIPPVAASDSLRLTLVSISVLPNLWSFQVSFYLVFMNILSNQHCIIIYKIKLKNQAKIWIKNLLDKTIFEQGRRIRFQPRGSQNQKKGHF